MFSPVTPMAVKSNLRKLIAQENLRRSETGEPVLSQASISRGSGVPQSVISTLVNGKSRRIDFDTINGLCGFFKVSPGALFDYTPDDPAEN